MSIISPSSLSHHKSKTHTYFCECWCSFLWHEAGNHSKPREPLLLHHIQKPSGSVCIRTEFAIRETSWVKWTGSHSLQGWKLSQSWKGPETYDLPERQCQDTTTAQHGSREGGDVITWGGPCYLHHFQFLNPSCLSDYFFKQKQSGNFSFWIYLTWILMLCI